MSNLETLKEQHPAIQAMYDIAQRDGNKALPEELAVAALVTALQQHEATIAELKADLSVMTQCRDELARQLAGSEKVIQQQARESGGAAADVLAERRRRVEVEGWTPERDDAHSTGEMAMAASCYAAVAGDPSSDGWYVEMIWPWDESWWKPGNARRNLIKAGALILAEIERLDRHSARAQQAEAKKEDRHVD